MMIFMAISLSDAEKADRINGAVQISELPSDDVGRLVLGPLAREFYGDDIYKDFVGIRYRHVARFANYLSTLSEGELEALQVSPNDVRVLSGFLRQSGMVLPVEPMPDAAQSTADETAKQLVSQL